MTAEPLILITSLLLQMVTSFLSRNKVTNKNNTRDLKRQWATSSSVEYPRWRTITGNKDNYLASFAYIVVASNPKQVYIPSHTCTAYIDNGRQLLLLLKLNYSRFATITHIAHKKVWNSVVYKLFD